jgi:hypothetical protein
MAYTLSSKIKEETFGSAPKQKEYADMMGKHLPGLKKKDLLVLPFLLYLKTVRAAFGLVIMAPDYLDMMERL